MQDAFERAMREARFFDEVREPAAWLRTVATRLAISRARRRAVWGRILPRLREPEVSYDPAILDLRRALEALPPQQRAAVVLRYYVGADYEEIADAVGLAPSSVGPLLSRIRSKLREALQWRTTTAS